VLSKIRRKYIYRAYDYDMPIRKRLNEPPGNSIREAPGYSLGVAKLFKYETRRPDAGMRKDRFVRVNIPAVIQRTAFLQAREY
jgi:Glu-tRNA(Gln) amidotransferase subunit E-like FAD-binding protein